MLRLKHKHLANGALSTATLCVLDEMIFLEVRQCVGPVRE
jgi:hypothetical protein